MEINYINEFVMLAKVGKFQDAANLLFISQSALSKHIKAIENEFGTTLFDRTSRKAELTEFGEKFFPIAVQIAELQKNYNNLLHEFAGQEEGLAIGVSTDAMIYGNVIHPLIDMLQKSTKRKINIIEDTETRIKELLWIKECEFVLLYQLEELEDPNENDFNSLPLFRDKIAALIPNQHPLAHKSSVSIEQLKDEHLVLTRAGSFFRDVVDRLYRDAGFEPNNDFQVTRRNTLYDMVHDGTGIALYSRNLADIHLELNPGYFTIVKFDVPVKLSYNVLYRKYSSLPDHIEKDLIDLSERLTARFAHLD